MCLRLFALTISVFSLLLSSHVAFAQSDRGGAKTTGASSMAIEVKDDRFGGGRTVRLKPQPLLDTPEQYLTISLEYKQSQNNRTGVDELDKSVMFYFTSLATKRFDFGDKALRFLVDGQPVDGGTASNRIFRGNDLERPLLRSGEGLIAILSLPRFSSVASGRRVEMRLGPLEMTLSDDLLARFREFAAAASK